MADQVLAAPDELGVAGTSVRTVDLDVRPGVEKDTGDGDAWPAVREQVPAADILVVATPTWMGHMSSVASRVTERLDAELSERDDQGRWWPSSLTRTARTRSPRTCSSVSTTSVPRCPRRAAATGTGRRRRPPTSRTSPRRRRP
jgi:multimeric flavodoxin WrbA